MMAASPLLYATAGAQTPSEAADDARALIDLIFENYAYPERLEGFSAARLRTLREVDAPRVSTRADLITFGERALAAIFDNHAILNTSRADSYGLVPSFNDIWIETDARGRYVVEDVRAGSPAMAAGVRPGDVLVAVEGQSVDRAVAAFIEAPVRELTPAQRALCARVLVTGRRDRPRHLAFTRGGVRRTLAIDNLYQSPLQRGDGPVTSRRLANGALHIRYNDSLGDGDSIAAFDAALGSALDAPAILVDLRDTGSGGNTSVARGAMSRFVDMPRPYQHHEFPAETRETGVRRSWIEEVSPRGVRYAGPVFVLAGRWTGSMGEGMAIGFDAIGARVVGTRMAGLLGAVYDLPLPHSGITLKLPAERLTHVNGTPREAYAPPILLPFADAPDANGADPAIAAALAAAG